MKAEKWQSMLWAAVIGFLIAFGGAGCVATGMRLANINLWLVAAACALSAAVFAVCVRVRLGLIPLCGLALLTGYLWQSGALNNSLEVLLYQITRLYDQGYGWGVIQWSTAGVPDGNATLALALCASPIAALIAWTVAGKCRFLLGGVVSFLPLVVCVVLTDTVPRVWCLFALFFGVVLLLLTQTVRRKDPRRGNALTAVLVLPVALALGLLFLAIPQKGYDRQTGADRLEDVISDWFNVTIAEKPQLPTRPAWVGASGDMDSGFVNLAATGPQANLSTGVLTVTADTSGRLYLRGNAYDIYSGNSWGATKGQWPWDSQYPYQTSWESGTALLEFRRSHSIKYFSYNPDEDLGMTDGRIENPYSLDTYTIQYDIPPAGYHAETARPLLEHELQRLQPYLQLPSDTAANARQILRKISTGNMNNPWLYAGDIANYVKNSAQYDLQTQKMPGGLNDFAIWFLENSDTGYCVHFATAATVLLRAAGIPARYVTGYMTDVQAGVKETVLAKDAHAWVECYIGGVGWVALEATPADGQAPVTPETTPDDTEPSEEPTTEPDQTDDPSETPSSPTIQGGVDGLTAVQTRGGFFWKVLLSLLAVTAAAIVQWRLRLWLKWRRQRRGRANAQALARWQEAELVARLLKQPPDGVLRDLALKAKFSQYSLTAAELRQFDSWLSQAKKTLRSRPIWHQLLYTLILAIY